MAFHLNLGRHADGRALRPAAASIIDLRQAFQFSRRTEVFSSPGLYVTTAMLTFFLGVTLDSLRLGQNVLRHDFDMTPVGSIVAKPLPAAHTAAEPGQGSCR